MSEDEVKDSDVIGDDLKTNLRERSKSEGSSVPYDQAFADKFNLSAPWTLTHYVSTSRGSENFHIYLWIAKDIGWTQGYIVWGNFFGVAAFIWCFVILYNYYRHREYEEIYMLGAVFLWLYANYWWMYGEIVNNDDDVNGKEAAHVFVAAFVWLAIYHIILKPLKVFGRHKRQEDSFYEKCGLTLRCPCYFDSFRQYEHIHTLFWLGKDFAWNLSNGPMWIVFLIPTLAVAVDFIYLSYTAKVKYVSFKSVYHVNTVNCSG
jgi:hypothetical protein